MAQRYVHTIRRGRGELHVHIRPDMLDLFWPRNDVTAMALTEFYGAQRRLR